MAISQKAKNAFAKLCELEGAVNDYDNPHLDVIRTGSPSLNFTFGNGWGLPAGYSILLWGPPKGGKTLVSNSMIGQLHQDDPDAFAIKFNTEQREVVQLSPAQMKNWGIERERYKAYEVNSPDLIYDRIAGPIADSIEAGLKIKLVIIDSINDVFGRRVANRMNSEKGQSILGTDIGDQAQTTGDGLRMILGVQRKYKFGLVLICQQRAELDQLEQMRGNKTKPGVSNASLHHCEFSMHVERNVTAAGKTSLTGEAFMDDSVSRVATAADGKKEDGEKTGHKIRAIMKDSSMGPKGRVGELTFDYDKGIINVHEEVFLLGVNRGVIERPNNTMYTFGDKEWKGKASILEALRTDDDMQAAVLKELRARDIRGDYNGDNYRVKETVEE